MEPANLVEDVGKMEIGHDGERDDHTSRKESLAIGLRDGGVEEKQQRDIVITGIADEANSHLAAIEDVTAAAAERFLAIINLVEPMFEEDLGAVPSKMVETVALEPLKNSYEAIVSDLLTGDLIEDLGDMEIGHDGEREYHTSRSELLAFGVHDGGVEEKQQRDIITTDITDETKSHLLVVEHVTAAAAERFLTLFEKPMFMKELEAAPSKILETVASEPLENSYGAVVSDFPADLVCPAAVMLDEDTTEPVANVATLGVASTEEPEAVKVNLVSIPVDATSQNAPTSSSCESVIECQETVALEPLKNSYGAVVSDLPADLACPAAVMLDEETTDPVANVATLGVASTEDPEAVEVNLTSIPVDATSQTTPTSSSCECVIGRQETVEFEPLENSYGAVVSDLPADLACPAAVMLNEETTEPAAVVVTLAAASTEAPEAATVNLTSIPVDATSKTVPISSSFFCEGLNHVAFCVHNLEKSLAFYCGLLGLRVDYDRPDLPYRGAWLTMGAEGIHLMEVPNPDPVEGRPGHGGYDRHACINVRNVEGVRITLENAGVAYQRSMVPSIFSRDPDGNGLEFIEVCR